MRVEEHSQVDGFGAGGPRIVGSRPSHAVGSRSLVAESVLHVAESAFSLVVASVVLAPNNCAAPLYRKSKEGVAGIAD